MSDQFEKFEQVFEFALNLNPEELKSFLDRECSGNDELRSEVESLLTSHQKAQSFFQDAAVEDAVMLFADDRINLKAGHRIGPYSILRQIGRGGMGAVYLAERADQEFQQQVAVKIVKRGMDTDRIIGRFLAERQILAGLNHPNIARLLDGGTTEEGQPYFVMEHIKGAPIGEYCDKHKLSTAERLKLFRKVCAAVQYAHRNLVIHRDIKSSNILVTREGEPKLLDFGIAKLLNSDSEAGALTRTETASRIMTPDYASPEQVRGSPVTTASDVYSLGVLLYRLLTGHHPYRLKTVLPREVERVICEEEVEKPSAAISRVEDASQLGETESITPEIVSEARATDPEKLRRLLSEDLDNIVLMALRKEPERRYASVEQFSEDIRRHSDGLPVIARHDTLRYRAGKFVRRNKTAVAAVSLILLALIGGMVATAWQASVATKQARIAAEERDRARVETAKSERIKYFLQNLLNFSNPMGGRYAPKNLADGQSDRKKGDTTIAEVLEEASRRIESELADQPEVMAEMQLTLGETLTGQGRFSEAKRHLRASLDGYRQSLGEDHSKTVQSMVSLADALLTDGEYDEAEPLYRKAIGILSSPSGDDNVDVWVRTIALNGLGVLLSTKGEAVEAESLAREAIKLSPQLTGSERSIIPLLLNNLGQALTFQGDLERGIDYYREAYKEYGSLPGGPWGDQALVLCNLGSSLKALGRYAEAEATLRQSIEQHIKTAGEIHAYTPIPIIHLADTHYHLGNYAAAKAEVERALKIQRQTLPDGHPYFTRSWLVLGKVLTKTGQSHRGESLLRTVLETRQRIVSKPDSAVAEAMVALGECLLAQKRHAEARRLLTEGHALYADKFGAEDPRTKTALALLSNL